MQKVWIILHINLSSIFCKAPTTHSAPPPSTHTSAPQQKPSRPPPPSSAVSGEIIVKKSEFLVDVHLAIKLDLQEHLLKINNTVKIKIPEAKK